MPPLMGNEGDTHVRERSHLQGPQLPTHPSSLPSSPCLCPFLFNTDALSASLPPYSPPIYLAICLSSYLPGYLFVVHIPYAYDLIVWLNQMDLPSLKVFFHKKQMIALQMVPPHLKQMDSKLARLHFCQF